MLTPFGKAARKLRIEKGLRLLDVAYSLGVTASYVSAVETGRRQVTEEFALRVAHALQLNESESDELVRSAQQTTSGLKINIENLPPAEREVMAAFARRINTEGLNAEDLEKLREIVFKVANGSQPFLKRGFLVPPLQTKVIRTFAERIRATFIKDNVNEFPIMDILEFRLHRLIPDFVLEVMESEEMDNDEGRTIHGTNKIILRRDVYEGAWNSKGRDRFTASHELGHLLLHSQVAFTRMESSEAHPIYRDSEWQADEFASTLLVPPHIVKNFAGPLDLAAGCKITPSAAAVIWSKHVI